MNRNPFNVEPDDLPLTVSRPALLEKGGDRRFRSLVHDLLSFADQIVSIRNGLARQLYLSGMQYTILTTVAWLQADRSAVPSEIARCLHLSESFVGGEAARLVELGILERRLASDGSEEGFALSQEGRSLLGRIAEIQRPVNDALFESLGENDFRSLSDMVRALSDCGERARAVGDSLHGRMTLMPNPSAAGREEEIDPKAFRAGLGHFATGVAVVTAEAPNGNRIGLTISSFNSVSLSPPLVLFSIARNVYSLVDLEASHRYAVNILQADQRELSGRFSRAGADKWNGVLVRRGTSGCPLLEQSLASFECVPYAAYDGGDHVIFVGRVVRYEANPQGAPLLFFRGNYAALQSDNATP